jgi:nucleoside-diphosphate-sugar epimerase
MREPISRAQRREERGSELPAPVVVVGAGWIGSRVAVELAASGVAVVAATRSGAWRGEAPPPPRVSLRSLDLLRDDPADIAAALAVGCAAVACLAPGRDQERRSVYVEGARRFALSSAAASLARAVWCSSTSALPAADGDVDEDCDAWPLDERGRVQREAEEVFSEGCRESATPWVILRLAGLYGPGRDLERLYRRPPTPGGHIGASAGAAADEPPLPGDGSEPTNLVHRDDVVAAIIAALRLDPSVSTLVHVCDRDHSTRRELLARLAARDGSPPPRWEREAGPPRGKRVAGRRLEAVLGVVLAHPRHTP